MNKNVLSTALKGIAVAMGIAVITLNTLGDLADVTAVSLLGIGLAALAMAALR